MGNTVSAKLKPAPAVRSTKKNASSSPELNNVERTVMKMQSLGFIQEDDFPLVLLRDWSLCCQCEPLFRHGSCRFGTDYSNVGSPIGCDLCKAIRQTLHCFDAWGPKSNGLASHHATFLGTTIQIQDANDIPKTTTTYLSIERDFMTSPPLDLIPGSNQALPDKALAFIKRQLTNCCSNTNHDCGPKPSEDVSWPSRLLKLDGCVTLVDFEHATMAGQYAALSYCWGDKAELEEQPPLKATTSTLSDLQAGIAMTKLPLTLLHAVYICLNLGIHYIWIDSLCILQDSRVDWEIEAQKMGAVYSLSKVTIIAASSTSCHSGFLDADIEPETAELVSPLPAPFRLVARRQLGSGFHAFKGHERPVFDPIDRRGWTFQESYLSTRSIRFTRDDVQWTCNAGTACLCGQPVSPRKGQLDFKHSTCTIHEHWKDIVSNFAPRKFSVETDKLQALSSLAKHLAPAFEADNRTSRYIGGMWLNDDLAYGELLWYNWQGKGILPTHYIAPSFSWASLSYTGKVMFKTWDFSKAGPMSKLVASGTQLRFSNDRFGRVSGGFVTLCGPLIKFQEMEEQGLIREVWRKFDCQLELVPIRNGRHTLRRCGSDTGMSDDELGEEWKHQEGFVLIMHEYCTSCVGLLLTPLVDGDGYQRIGLIYYDRVSFDPEYVYWTHAMWVEYFKKWTHQTVTIY